MGTKPKPHQDRHIAGPIRSSEEIKRIRSILFNKPRDLLLFDLAVQTGIGMKNLLPLRIKNLSDMRKGEKVQIRTERGKDYGFTVTDEIYETFHRYLKEVEPKPNDYVFKSKKGQRPLNLSSVSNMINGWYKAAGIKGCFGAISLRKTWEYHRKGKLNFSQLAGSPKAKSVFRPIETSSVQKTIYNELFNAIVSSKIKPGTRLTTANISKSFKVSQAPVRVALNWLEAKGFIVSQKKSGSIVKELTIEELHEIIQIRIILETAAARLAYKVRTEETLELLESLIERYKKAYTFEDADQLNRLFHQILYRDTKMPLLIAMITDLYDRFSPYAAFAFAHIGRMPDYNPNQDVPEYFHVKILEGMRSKNLHKILENIEMDLGRAIGFTEEVLKARQRSESE
jgi:DNA-binding GntR family transcriptional regulator